MKDIKGNIVKKGDNVLIIEHNDNKVPATILGVGKTKVKLQLKQGTIVVEQTEVAVQLIKAKGLQGSRKTSSLVESLLKDTNPTISARDNVPGVGLDTLRLFGVGFDTKHPAMRLTESQKQYNSYGTVYRLLKEAFDKAAEDDNLEDVAEAISKIALYLGNKMNEV